MNKLFVLLLILPIVCFSQPKWEEVFVPGSFNENIKRLKIPEGWLIYSSQRVTFVPDKNHEWKINND